ncbi:MAG: glutamate-5-semialdehyde dehydrogenase [Nitrospirae bacterium]|nr:glutamate-5-semialdehyde dehydrogenase [Nitrospirota bacterium]
MVEVPVKIYMTNLAKKAREAARPLSLLAGAAKTLALRAMADRLLAEEKAILAANLDDVESVGKKLEGETNKDTVKEAVERVRFTADDLREMAGRLREIAELPDPIGEITQLWRRPNGMEVRRVRAPLGVIGIVSDLGPKHTTEAVALCLKSGNVSVVRGSPDWAKSNPLIGTLISEAAESAGVPAGAVSFIERTEREAALELLRQTKYLDAIIPRGGAGLRKTVMEQTKLPVLCHDAGLCFVYVDAEADLPLAQNIVVNSKVQQPSASNAVDTLLVHQAIARPLLPALVLRLLDEFKVDILGCPKTLTLTSSHSFTGYKNVKEATEGDWEKQFLSRTLAVKVVKDLDEALAHMARHGLVHTATIVTKDYRSTMRFTREVDACAVLVNASTRMHDGNEFGLGGEVGANTLRVHARGPISLEALTCLKYVVMGNGQLRRPHPVPATYEDAIMLKRPS